MAITVIEAVRGVKTEAGEILEEVQNQISALDFSVDSLSALKEKYNLITRDVLGVSYDTLVDDRELPPVDPDTLFDEKRLGFVDLTLLGPVFFPSQPDNILRATQEFYLSVDQDLEFVATQLEEHPPGIPATDTFTNASNRFVISATSSRNSAGVLKTQKDVEEELGINANTSPVFSFPDISQLLFVVTPEFISTDEPMSSIGRRLDINLNQITNRVNWFGHINATSSNFSKMRTTLGLPGSQIRSASFGDDMAISSSSLFRRLLGDMAARFTFVTSSLPTSEKLINILNGVQEEALAFLAQISFGVTVLSDNEVVVDAREGGVSQTDLETSFATRDDPSYSGADLKANNLRHTVFPSTSNAADRDALAKAIQQDPDTLRYTNKALNPNVDLRRDVVDAAKRLVASLQSRQIVLNKENLTLEATGEALAIALADLTALVVAYELFLDPPEAPARRDGTRTTESANLSLSRATNLTETLRIVDQATNFPKDFQGEVSDELEAVLSSVVVMSRAIQTYLNIYRNGETRDFLASAVSVSSMTNLLLADGQPPSSLIVQEIPETIEKLKDNIQTVLLDDPETQNLYSNVSLQVGAFASVLRGNSDDDPVGRLFDLPISVLDALLPSETVPLAYSITLEGDQEEALRQIRESFDVLRRTVPATIRDLGVLTTNFGCAFTDAKFFVARLAGDSVADLVVALRQS